ncbi:MiaB/RimO family radical SAM methylthiotransferase [Enhygromyxa salina]|uniref:tRNA (N(6)-L-threonylcarbamoyladenosine(37)-C(2))-methylthiotransferase n=1 Tax=Enhygromyxa salina TaxID=215803 RepID=A0A2S9XWY6_9BACT|nr:MiaB/RimO family radical SAM methylthiotransferase [Enhygromyxa salina]PRP97375.1 Threonylcarbamoyladenosine tRNA methylthiotransferase MtaB [Enhygromyxa salina]
MRFAVETHGCRLNQAETDAIVEQLLARGHEAVEVERAQVYVLNSCTITHAADADARAAIRRVRRRNPDARLVITGCYANAAPEQLAAMPELDAVIGNVEKRGPELLDVLQQLGTGPRPRQAGAGALVSVARLTRKTRPELWTRPPATAPQRTRPLLEIQDGCDYQCSFCVVPSVRGRSRSAPPELASAQLATLLRAGAPEVVLTGAHLGSWGRDLRADLRADRVGQGGLAALVATLLREHPGARLRLGSVDPHEVDAPLVELLGRGVDSAGAGLCPHIHLPVQSGDDQILRAMRRAHRVADLEQLIPRLRAAAPGIGLGTDVIVGFPGEDDAAFERTLALFEVTAIPFAHVFVWSPREGTPAATMGDRVSRERAADRSRVLRDRVASNHRAFAQAQLGHERSAVILQHRHRSTGALVALADNYARIFLDGPDRLLGQRVRVRADSRTGDRLSGRLVE